MGNSHLEYQVGGKHYKLLKIQPAEFCLANMTIHELIGVMKWMTMKYTWREKDSLKLDREKTMQYIEMIGEELDRRAEGTK